MGTERGGRYWRAVRTFPVVGCPDSALSGWLEHGNLGAGIAALVVDIGHWSWTLVPGNPWAGFEAFVATWRSHVSPAGHHHRRRWRADHSRLHPPAASGATSFGPARLSCEVVGARRDVQFDALDGKAQVGRVTPCAPPVTDTVPLGKAKTGRRKKTQKAQNWFLQKETKWKPPASLTSFASVVFVFNHG